MEPGRSIRLRREQRVTTNGPDFNEYHSLRGTPILVLVQQTEISEGQPFVCYATMFVHNYGNMETET